MFLKSTFGLLLLTCIAVDGKLQGIRGGLRHKNSKPGNLKDATRVHRDETRAIQAEDWQRFLVGSLSMSVPTAEPPSEEPTPEGPTEPDPTPEDPTEPPPEDPTVTGPTPETPTEASPDDPVEPPEDPTVTGPTPETPTEASPDDPVEPPEDPTVTGPTPETPTEASPDDPVEPPVTPDGALTLESTAFPAGGPIPVQYTCEGEDLSPPLSWSNVPDGTVVWALTVEDNTVPWNQWVVFNVAAPATVLPQGVPSSQGEFSDGSVQGTNSFGNIGYGGMCPSEEDTSEHTYTFTLYALNAALTGLSTATTKDELEQAIADANAEIATAELIGTYAREAAPDVPPPVEESVTPAPVATPVTEDPVATPATEAPVAAPVTPPASGGLALESTAFSDGGAIPVDYTCDGQDISPPLSWSPTPEGTVVWALTVEDNTVPWNQWVLFNVGAVATSIPQGIPAGQGQFSDGSFQGTNSFGNIGYGGMCPAEGDFSEHSYTFRLYALNAELTGISSATTKEELEQQIAEQSAEIDRAELSGTYQREE